ncbi:MAG: class I SAM-dependent methyltransferase [Burkholderiales bacterium]
MSSSSFTVQNGHEFQRDIWEKEHFAPSMFPFLDSHVPSPGVVQFWDWMTSAHLAPPLTGLEICCGKGRNAIWLAGRGCKMFGFDYSEVAISEAIRRQLPLSLPEKIDFSIHDAVQRWPYGDHQFDFVIDCFGSSDVESLAGRRHILDEALRVLKPSGLFHIQIDSPELGFFAERYREAPGDEPGTLLFPNGKVEAVLTESELATWRHPLRLVEIRREVETTLEICGQVAPYKYYWIVARAPN